MRETDPAHRGSVALAHEILAYMVEHPKAQDTFEGIVQWWLLERQIRNWTVKIRAALAVLVEEGLVLERAGRDGRARYSINRGKLPQIRARLHDASEPKQLQG